MSILFDLLLVLIIFVSIVVGVNKGFIRSVMNFVTFIAAFICARLFTPILKAVYLESYFMKKVTEVVSDAIGSIIGTSSITLDNLLAEQPSAFMSIVDRYLVDIAELERFYYSQASGDVGAVEENVSAFIAQPVAEALSTVLAFLTIFVGVIIVLTLAATLLDLIFKLPALSTINRFLGFLVGAVCGLLYAWAAAVILVAVAPSLSAVFPEVFSESLVENSILLNVFYEFNPFTYLGMVL